MISGKQLTSSTSCWLGTRSLISANSTFIAKNCASTITCMTLLAIFNASLILSNWVAAQSFVNAPFLRVKWIEYKGVCVETDTAAQDALIVYHLILSSISSLSLGHTFSSFVSCTNEDRSFLLYIS